MTTTESDASKALADLGFALEILSGPKGAVDQDNWPHIAYKVRLSFNGKTVTEIPYHLGIGYVDPKKDRTAGRTLSRFTVDEESLLMTWQSKPQANFKDKALQASVAGKLAVAQKVQPSLASVLHSLLLDGDAFFNALSFEDWASELGYDADSRKAESIYRECDRIGRALAQNVPSEALAAAREALQDF